MGDLRIEPGAGSPQLGQLLNAIPLFAGMSPQSLVQIEAIADPFACPAGEVVFEQNDIDDGVYIVESGEVAIIGRTPGDSVRLLAMVGRGEVFGEFCLLDGGRRSAEARATEDTRGYRIDLDRFAAMRASGNQAAFDVLRPLYSEVAERTRATIGGMAVPSAEQVSVGAAVTGASCDGRDCSAQLSTFPGFDRCSTSDWDVLAALCERMDVPRGTLLEPAGAPQQALYIVARGALRTGLPNETGSLQLLVHGPGSLSGAAALINGGDWPTSVEVREDAIVFAMTRPAFAKLLAAHTPLARRLFDQLGRQMTSDLRRISRARTRIDIVSVHSGEAA